MNVSRIIVLPAVVLSLVCLSYQMLPDDVGAIQVTAPPFVTNRTCVHQHLDGNFIEAANCTNGKRMPGCCVDRLRCNYNTSNIDLTMYEPRGYRKTCESGYTCCPFQYVLPIEIKNDSNFSE